MIGVGLGPSVSRTLVLVKPDGVQRGLAFRILARFQQRGLTLHGLKLLRPSKDLLHAHYAHARGSSYYGRLVSVMGSGPAVASVWGGLDAVAVTRAMIGGTFPADSAPGTIRGDFGLHQRRNLVHGSDSIESAEREIGLWFRPEELCEWRRQDLPWIVEEQ